MQKPKQSSQQDNTELEIIEVQEYLEIENSLIF